MAVFAVLADKPNDKLGEKIAALYPTDHYKLSETQWLISADAISQTVAEQLGIRKGAYGRVIVIRTTGSASGWHNKTAWEWLSQKAESA